MNRGLMRRLWIAGIMLAVIAPVWAQWTETMGQRGLVVPGASFDPSTIDSVDMLNGNAVMRIPITSMPAGHGGMSVDIALTYNSAMYDGTYSYSPSTSLSQYSADTIRPTATGDALGQWSYGYNYGLIGEYRTSGPPGCVDIQGQQQTVDFTNSSPAALYPYRLRAVFPDGSLHVLYLSNQKPDTWSQDQDLEGVIATGWFGINAAGTAVNTCMQTLLPANLSPPLHYFTLDGTYVRVDITTLADTTCTGCGWTMRFPDGRVVIGSGHFASSIADRNGNTVYITCLMAASSLPYFGTPTYPPSNPASPSGPCYPLHDDEPNEVLKLITDAYGHCIQIENANDSGGPFTDYISQAGAGYASTGAVNLWTLPGVYVPANFGYYYGIGECQYGYEGECDIEYQTGELPPRGYLCTGSGPALCPPQAGTLLPAFASIQLPASLTGESYSFGFTNSAGQNCLAPTIPANCQGQLTQITFPIGSGISAGAAQMQYAFNVPGTCGTSGDASTCDPQDMPIGSKMLSHHDPLTGAALTDAWTYTIPYGGVADSGNSSIVKNPDGGLTTHWFNNIYSGTTLAGLTYEIDQPDGSATQQIWAHNGVVMAGYPPGSPYPAGNPFIQAGFNSVANSGAPALTATTTYTYDSNGNPILTSNYNWINYPFGSSHTPVTLPSGLGNVVRTTNNTYYLPADTSSNSANGYWSSSTPNLLSAKTSTLVAESALKSYSEFAYDGATTTGNVTAESDWDSTLSGFPGQIGQGTTSGNLNSSNARITQRTYTGSGVPTPNGDVLSETDPRAITRTYSYGGSGLCAPYPTALSEGSGVRNWGFAWDCDTRLRTSETDEDNHTVTSAAYDQLGRQTNVTRPNGQQINTAYNDPAQTATTKTDLANPQDGSIQAITSRDDLGRGYQTQETSDVPNCTWIITQTAQQTVAGSGFSYQLTSNPYCSSSDPTMGWTLTTSDNMGRVLSVGHYAGSGMPGPWGGSGNSTGVAYNSYGASSSGSTTTVTDEAGVTRTTTSDSLGRLTQVLDGTGVTTTYGYALNNLTSVSQSAQSRSFSYSSLNRLTSAANPENGTINYTYDPDGNLASKTFRNQTITESLTYNSLNQLLTRQYTDTTPAVSYTFGQTSPCGSYSVGRLCSVASSASTTSYAYAEPGGKVTGSIQTTPTTGGTSYQFSYGYNLNDGLALEGYPSGRIVSYAYNSAGRPNQVVNGLLVLPVYNYVSNLNYAPQHAIGSMTLGNNIITESWAYDSRLQPTNVTASGGTSLTLGYVYSPTQNNGNILSASIGFTGVANYCQVFSYDGVNRLFQATEISSSGSCPSSSSSNWSQSFSYDNYGNRAVTNSGAIGTSPLTQTLTSCFNANNQNSTSGSCPSGWSYDSSGNITADPGPSTYAYDAENRQVAYCASTSPCSTASATTVYLYDGDGNRVQKQGSDGTTSGTTTFVYDAMGHVAAEYGSPALPCLAPCYVTVDALGSTRMVTDVTGNCFLREDYLPFGQTITSTSANRGTCYNGTTIRQQFTSKERDAETGLDYFGARYYSGAQGRWTSPEYSMNAVIMELPQTWNKYSYVYNRPTYSTDPDGHCPPCIGAIVGGIVEGGFDLGKQLYSNGGNLGDVHWGEVGANALGGAVAGTIAVATGGTSLVANAFIGDVVAGGTANVVGGIVTRAAEGQSANEVLSGSELSQDAVTGFVGGGVGHVAGEFVHVPDEPVHNGRASVGAIRRDDSKFAKYRGALTNQITRATVGSSTTTHTMNGGFSLWNWLFSAPPPPPPTPKPVIACTSASDSQGNSTGTHCE